MAPTVLFIRNEHLATEAMLGEAFTDCGYDVATFDVVPADRSGTPDLDVTFPDPLRYDAIVPLGASWPVYGGMRWVDAEMQMVRDADAAGVATLGVCFGGQLVARAFGGTVARSDAPEIGWYEVSTDDEELVPGGQWFQWHSDRWTLPPGATEIARTANASQAFVVSHALALQFHPELHGDLLELWLAADHDGDLAAMGRTAADLRAATADLQPGAAVRIRALVRGFTRRMVGQPRPS